MRGWLTSTLFLFTIWAIPASGWNSFWHTVAAQRIALAGARLANLLNAALK
jgi:hypothetical protein